MASQRLVLRQLEPGDQAGYLQLRQENYDWLKEWEPTSPNGISEPLTYQQLLRRTARAALEGTGYSWVLALSGARAVPIGQVSVSGVQYGAALDASIGYWISQSHAGFGLMPEACALVVDHCFGTLGLHRLEINIRPENAPSLAVVRKLGFRDEGVRRAYLHINGAWRDHRTFALTRQELNGSLLERMYENRHI